MKKQLEKIMRRLRNSPRYKRLEKRIRRLLNSPGYKRLEKIVQKQIEMILPFYFLKWLQNISSTPPPEPNKITVHSWKEYVEAKKQLLEQPYRDFPGPLAPFVDPKILITPTWLACADGVRKNVIFWIDARNFEKPQINGESERSLVNEVKIVQEVERVAGNNVNIFLPFLEDILRYKLSDYDETDAPFPFWLRYIRISARRGVDIPQNLTEYFENLTQKVLNDELDPIIGRDREVKQIVSILCRMTKPNVMLLGPAGVGKTALAEAVARFLVEGGEDIPERLRGKVVLELKVGTLSAGACNGGAFSKRLVDIMNFIIKPGGSPQYLIFMDEIHTFMTANIHIGQPLAPGPEILKPHLARGSLQLICATTDSEYKVVDRNRAFARRFTALTLGEPSIPDTIKILTKLRKRFEDKYKVSISDEAIVKSVEYSVKYMINRTLPDKAIDLLSFAANDAVKVINSDSPAFKVIKNLKDKKNQILLKEENAIRDFNFEEANVFYFTGLYVGAQLQTLLEYSTQEKLDQKRDKCIKQEIIAGEDIAEAVYSLTGIPIQKLSQEEVEKLELLNEALHKRVIGQSQAVQMVSDALKRRRSGFGASDRPIGTFLFGGPSGVGKTELAKAIAEVYFGSEGKLIRLDMSEFQSEHDISKIIGAGGKDVRGTFVYSVKKNPHTVILLDEIEKASVRVLNIFLQVFDYGRLTDTSGETTNFNNTIIILTTNLGGNEIREFCSSANFDEDKNYTTLKSIILNELEKNLTPELLGRLTGVIPFYSLSKDELSQVRDLLLRKVKERFAMEYDLQINTSNELLEYMIKVGYQPAYGARPMRRVINRLTQDFIIEEFLAGKIKKGDSVLLDLNPRKKVIIRPTCLESEKRIVKVGERLKLSEPGEQVRREVDKLIKLVREGKLSDQLALQYLEELSFKLESLQKNNFVEKNFLKREKELHKRIEKEIWE